MHLLTCTVPVGRGEVAELPPVRGVLVLGTEVVEEEEPSLQQLLDSVYTNSNPQTEVHEQPNTPSRLIRNLFLHSIQQPEAIEGHSRPKLRQTHTVLRIRV